MANKDGRINELRPEFLGIQAINSFAPTNSPSRSTMLGSHFTQHLVTNGMDEKIIYAGPEQELAKYSLGIRMPCDGKIVAVINKYPAGVGANSIASNPEILVVYEKAVSNERDSLEIDCFTIPTFRSFHQYFGWSCEFKEGMEHLRQGAFIPKGTVFADTPGVKDGNSYVYGRNTKVAYMSVPGVAEDGIVVSKAVLKHWKYELFDERTIQWGSSCFPLDIYGPGKPFPDIGDYVREDGLLMALRNYDPDMFAVDIGQRNRQIVDYKFDRLTYVSRGKGRVIDIEIFCGNNPNRNMPNGMSTHADKYTQAYLQYNQQILELEERIRSDRRRKYGVERVTYGPAFNKIVVRALALTNYTVDRQSRNQLKLLYRKEPIDEYYAKFVVKYELEPWLGDKLSNQSGSKGVICKIMEEHEMPIRPDGVRAEMIIDPGPVFHRMNIGQSFEQYFTCAARDVAVRLAHHLKLIPDQHADSFEKRPEVSQEYFLSIDRDLFEEAYKYLISFYSMFGDKQAAHFKALSYEDRAEHLSDVINEGIPRIFFPVDNERLPSDVVHDVEKHFKPTMTQVEYIDQWGQKVKTVKNVMIGDVYMFLLDKLASEWSATATARLQHFGILSSVTKSEKFSFPYRNSPTRVSGETESRIFACYCPPEAIAEMFDRTNNPITRTAIYRKLLESENPSKIKLVVDRKDISLGSSRPIQIIRHIFQCSGFRAVYIPESDLAR